MPQPDQLLFSRLLMGTSLAFHISFAVIGVGLPLLISLAEFIAIRRKDAELMTLAKRWTRGFLVLFAVGAASGTIVGIELSFLWPRFMEVASEAIALPFLIEVWAFFIESIFLGIYVYTWNRFRNPIHHWLCSLPIVVGSASSAILITTVNAFMNTPAGFDWVNGQMTNIRPLEAMLNPTTPVKVFHVVSTSWFAAAFVVGAVAAWAIYRGRDVSYFRKALTICLGVGLVAGALVILSGDMSAKHIAVYQPAKLAAAEALFETQPNAPLLLGGLIDTDRQEVRFAIELPSVLSFLAFGDVNAPVTGLDAIPRDQWPSMIVHYAFDLMVGTGFFAMAVAAAYLAWPFLGRTPLARLDLRRQKLMLVAILAAGPLSIVSIQAGWIVTELGRQPWILYGLMRTSEAVTTSPGVITAFFGYITLYTVLAVSTLYVVNKLAQISPLEHALAETGKATGWELPEAGHGRPGDRRLRRKGGQA